MIDISKPLTSGKVRSYYKTEYASASNSYFTQGNTLQGEWFGQLAAELNLIGGVSELAFERLAEGQHPETGEQLIKHRDTIKTQAGEEVGHRAGWDLTFNAPKTVSLTALVGQDERVRSAHREAVRIALAETEKYLQARTGGVNPPLTTGKAIAAIFEHDTARPVNGYPAAHLHSHVVLFNITEDHNGQARSLQPHELFRIQSMSTAVYQNALEHQLRRSGYKIETGKNHSPEIAGYSKDYLASESLRSAAIAQEMEEKGSRGREHRVQLAHQDRDEKLKLTPEELRETHQKNAERFGNQPAQVVSEAALHYSRVLDPEKIQARAQEAVTFARSRLTERNAVIEYFEIVRDALRHTRGRIQLAQVEREIERQIAAGQFIQVNHVRPTAPMARFTTPELVAVERETIQMVIAGQKQGRSTVAVTSSDVAARYNTLNEDQRRLVNEALNTKDQIFGIQGGAGTGKTTALTAIREIAEEHGYKTHGLGPTSRAAKGLKEAGIDSETLQSYLTRGYDPAEEATKRLFFVDEASLASGKQLRDFLITLGPDDRVLLVGDTRQHESVEAGRIFAQLQDAGMNTATLEKIVRQKEEGLRSVVEAMATGDVRKGVELLSSQNRVQSIEHRGERFEAIAKAYAAQPQGTLVISPDNQSRQELNAAIRRELRNTGQLQPDTFQLPILVTRQNLTSEDKGIAGSYAVGDAVRYIRGSEALGLEAKSYATVIASNREKNQITVKREDGRVVTYDPARLKGVTVYDPEIRYFTIGDRVQFTSPWRDKAIATRDTGTVSYIDKAGNIRVNLDDSRRSVSWNLKENKHLDHAYVMTSHSSQGATVDRALIHVDTSDTKTRALINQTLAYVALSRPRYDAQVFTDNGAELEKSLSRRQENSTALAPEQTTSMGIGA